MSDVLLNFSNVTFGFGKRKPLFEDLTCSLTSTSETGKIIALMGPSGVGKTTFCDLALGIRKPQKGSINFEPIKANVAVIPQKAVLFDELSVQENISCLKFSTSMGNTFQEQRIPHIVHSLGLQDVIRSVTRTSALSGGEAQRVMLARIQTIDCDVLILDEPCSFLDNRVKDTFLSALRGTVDEYHLLTLMVTHVWDEAQLVADEVLFFHQAPGKAVTLHCHQITEVLSRPPTIDALYGIHWPDCLVFDLQEIDLLNNLQADKIPNDARFVGLFQKDNGKYNQKGHWSIKLWDSIKKPSYRSDASLRTEIIKKVEEKNIASVFFNADGLLIND